LLPGRLPGARGYVGGADFVGYEDNMPCFTKKWASVILLGDYDSVCSDLRCAIDNWSGEKFWTCCEG